MADIKVPVKYSPSQARAYLMSMLASNKEGLAGERRIKDQIAMLAKGGAVTKQTPKQTKKAANVMGEFKEGKGKPMVAIMIGVGKPVKAKKK